jgi:hypothetical protein
MAIDLGQLFLGRLVYEEASAALDDVRFERIIRGFAKHYDVTTHSSSLFSFARGEGYLQISRGDAFGYVDSGSIERLSNSPEPMDAPGGNVILMPPRFYGLRFTLNIRVLLIYWAFALVIGWLFFGGDWMFWLVGFVAASTTSIVLIRRSLRAKLDTWLARESWN